MKNKQQMLAHALLVLGILVLVNIISIRLFTRLDLTAENVYTLSPASVRLMEALDDRLTVEVYFNEDLPAPYNSNRRAIYDVLNDYRAYAGDNLQYTFIDPSTDELMQEATREGIPPVEIQAMEADKFVAKRAYMGIVLLFEDRKEVIPVVQNTASLEYDLSSAIKRLVSRDQKTIGFLTGHGEPELAKLQSVQKTLAKQYRFTTVNCTNGQAVPDHVSVLVVDAPTKPIPEAEQFFIDQFIMKGGKVAFLLNAVPATLQQQYAQPLDLQLDPLLENYGLRLNRDLVRDVQCSNISLIQEHGGFRIQSAIPYPFLPVASVFDENNVMVKDLQQLAFFFVSSVDTVNPGSRGLKATVLVKSSERSGRQSGMFILDPRMQPEPGAFSESNIPLAIVVEGSFDSYYANRPVPTDTNGVPIAGAQTVLKKSPNTRLVLVGDGDFILDNYIRSSDNLTFFANMMDYLVDDMGLIAIRSKNLVAPPLDPVSDGTRGFVKWADLLIPPLLMILYGLFRWRQRKARKKALAVS